MGEQRACGMRVSEGYSLFGESSKKRAIAAQKSIKNELAYLFHSENYASVSNNDML